MLVQNKFSGGLLTRLSAIILMLALAASASVSQTEPLYEELPNFHQVNEHLYRGAQPRTEGGIRKLSALGIKSVLNLRQEGDNTRAEEKDARSSGLKYYSIPMEGMSKPTDAQIKQALAIINAEENWPVFVHCKRGADRTGTLMAIYRISHDNWTAHDAIKEARHYGMSRFELGMKHYIKDYEKQRQSN